MTAVQYCTTYCALYTCVWWLSNSAVSDDACVVSNLPCFYGKWVVTARAVVALLTNYTIPLYTAGCIIMGNVASVSCKRHQAAVVEDCGIEAYAYAECRRRSDEWSLAGMGKRRQWPRPRRNRDVSLPRPRWDVCRSRDVTETLKCALSLLQ